MKINGIFLRRNHKNCTRKTWVFLAQNKASLTDTGNGLQKLLRDGEFFCFQLFVQKFLARPVFRTKICRRPVFRTKTSRPSSFSDKNFSSFSQMVFRKKLSLFLKKNLARPVHLQNWSPVLFIDRNFISVTEVIPLKAAFLWFLRFSFKSHIMIYGTPMDTLTQIFDIY